ncbi:major facilitator superfamily domain-containing protein [Boletus edulis BED1]|uniref:Major facilitator superfamily domain-containing protein n=1 Tax=Boletus edulis BED1 TaxID=1328754 RepID=A0AAD4BXY5_BOLED|nr:major facilitator superfamily domain-containing protein [Boletus edulis BED1]
MAIPDTEKSSQVPETINLKDDSPYNQRLRRKVDRRLLPILTLLFLLSFLDRTNIGNAKIDGLTTDLGVSPSGYNIALALFFVGYVLFEIPSNLILKRFDPQVWLPSLTLVWGIVSIAQGFVTNQAGLFGIRFLLGMTEAGLFPGVIYVFSVYYLRRERSLRVAVFFGGAALAGAFGGIFAYTISLMNGIGGRKGWQWIFILEGILTVAVSLVAYFVVPTWSYKAKFLTEEERCHLIEKLQADSDAGTDQSFQWSSVRSAFEDHLVWAYSFLFHGFSFVQYSFSFFLPTIIADLGFETWQAQLLTVPPNAVAAFSVWGTVWVSSRVNMRAPFIIVAGVVAIIGYIILITSATSEEQYLGVHLVAAGVYTGNSLLLSWPGENVSGQTKRAVAVAMQIMIGDIGAIAGSLVYRPSLSAHIYRKPNLIAIGYVLFAILMAAYLWVMMARENKRRDAILANAKEDDLLETEEERLRLGDRSIYYRYQL